MAITSQRPAGPAATPADVLWQVRKGERHAEACVRVLDHGLELRITVDALLIFNKLTHDADLSAVLRESDVHLAAFVERGWLPQRCREPREARAATVPGISVAR